ncbi:hypothetical protein KUTeg_007493 [Tegillarca granosa]|uniref:Uncharacterized protein n=1 Tax=Tegillarca granosa TaxID=220873 RepID=A0ABQ9FHZ5_TEGGR|nr:hypothetical protein KUTeg_007493 [Tegillarca granosa]
MHIIAGLYALYEGIDDEYDVRIKEVKAPPLTPLPICFWYFRLLRKIKSFCHIEAENLYKVKV